MSPTTLLCPVCLSSASALGVIERGTYDGVLYWECETDGARWHRWPEGHWLHSKADPLVRERERTDDGEPLMTPGEVAKLFAVNPKTVTRWAKAGRLTAVWTLGGHRRYRRSEVMRHLHSDEP